MYTFSRQQVCLFKLSSKIWRYKSRAKSFGLNFNEEAATELLLLELAESFPGNVDIIPFSKMREGRIGADWALGFVGPDGCSFQGMLIQAKRLDDNEKEYSKLFYKKRPKGAATPKSQIDLLIDNAVRYQLPPVYVFYNHISSTRRIPTDICESLNMLHPLRFPQSWGVSLASAIAVRNSRPDKTFDLHSLHSMPLHCILCSMGTGQSGQSGSAGTAAAALTRLFGITDSVVDLGLELPISFEPKRELPELFQYAKRLRKNESIDGMKDLAPSVSDYPGIAGVVIVQDIRERD